MKVPFNRLRIVGKEMEYVISATKSQQLSGTGPFAEKCEKLLENRIGGHAFLVPSATAGLELSALLLDLGLDDEVIMPSFTFVSTANAFRLRGCRVRFCDVDPQSMNLNADQLEALVNERTRAIVPVHYAGVGCNMQQIMSICEQYDLDCVEDAAQGINACHNGRHLGTDAPLSVFSFHESKNLGCGEGGCLVVNDAKYIERARVIRDKGTNRYDFSQGKVDKYNWVDIGSSYVISELNAAYLLGQLECMDQITKRRLEIWNSYAEQLEPLRQNNLVSWNDASEGHNAHIFYLILDSEEQRNTFISKMIKAGIQSFFHYVPLHLSPVGKELGYSEGDLPITEDLASRLVRLPIFYSLSNQAVDYTAGKILEFFGMRANCS